MPRGTFVVECDLNDDFAYEENITLDVISANFSLGKSSSSRSPESGKLDLVVDNHLGRFNPRTTLFDTTKAIRLRSTAPAAVNGFTGFITSISISASPNQQTARITAEDRWGILKRNIVSLALMRNQSIGVIVNRILDVAEGSEICINPISEDSVSGWSPEGGTGAVVRSTGLTRLHDPASTQITASTILHGASYNSFNISLPDVYCVYAVYVTPTSSSEEGKTVTVIPEDSGGSHGSTSGTLVSGKWTRISTLVLWNTASTGHKIKVLKSISNGANAFTVGAIHLVKRIEALHPRDVDDGDCILRFYGPFRRPAGECIDEVVESEVGGKFYINGSGGPVFEQKTSRWASPTSLVTIDEDVQGMEYEESYDDRITKVELNYGSYVLGDPITYLWELELVLSKEIPASSSIKVVAPYGFLAMDIITELVGGVEQLVANTDWRANSSPEGTGTDDNVNIIMTLQKFGEGLIINLENQLLTRSVWLTQLTVRGTPIRESNDLPLYEYTPSSVSKIPNVLTYDYQLQDRLTDIESWAKYLGDRFSAQVERMSVTLKNKSNTQLTTMLQRVISDRVTIVNDNAAYSSKVNADYFIESVTHRIQKGAFLHETVWELVPVNGETYWILGDSTYGVLDSTTRLAP